IQRRKLSRNFLGCLAWTHGLGLRDDNAVGDAALLASQRLFPSDVILLFLSMVIALIAARNLEPMYRRHGMPQCGGGRGCDRGRAEVSTPSAETLVRLSASRPKGLDRRRPRPLVTAILEF